MLSSSYGMWQKPQVGGDGSSNLPKKPNHIISASEMAQSLIPTRTRTKINLWSVLPKSRHPSRMYRGFKMAAVPEADSMHTSSLCRGNTDSSKQKWGNI